jgi:hypothetical protein
MREKGDTRLASVYKPEKRGTLEVSSRLASILGGSFSSLPPVA